MLGIWIRLLGILLLGTALRCFADPLIAYQEPSETIRKLAETPWLPTVAHGPHGKYLLKMHIQSMVPLEIVARAEVKLAGLEINPQTHGPSLNVHVTKLELVDISSGEVRDVAGLPDNPGVINLSWSPNGEYAALVLEDSKGVRLWKLDLKQAVAKLWIARPLHVGLDVKHEWATDSKSIWVKLIPEELPPLPSGNLPFGPTIKESYAQPMLVETFPSVIENTEDKMRFSHYLTSQMARVTLDGEVTLIGNPGLISRVNPSPDGNYLLVQKIIEPWSLIWSHEYFPESVEIMSSDGQWVYSLPDIPQIRLASGKGGFVREGPRLSHWRSDTPSTLVWSEAQDEGNPFKKVNFRDIIYSFSAPFKDEPTEVVKLKNRLGGILWHSDEFSILVSWNWFSNTMSYFRLTFEGEGIGSLKKLISFSLVDRYKHPGSPMMELNDNGFPILLMDPTLSSIYLTGEGASKSGNKPFIQSFDVNRKKTKMIFQSNAPYYEVPIRFIDFGKGELLVKRESVDTPPDYYLWTKKKGFYQQLTKTKNPYVENFEYEKELLRYKRKDGVALSATLYLPKNYHAKSDGPLPTLVWAYPKSFINASSAGQVTQSPYEFTELRWYGPAMWTQLGYAVLDNPSMPIVGKKNKNPNDTFIHQLVASANAAVRQLKKRGISESGSIAIGGHSYGAFMAANLLAHSDLFSAGIGRSGAYNRTLTPFGFQTEERSIWEAPSVYLKMSPFLSASNIHEPFLLLHGENDGNTGTYPLQSRRMFHALNGLGKDVRLVMFPFEGHSLRSRESIMHTLWEIENWLDEKVKKQSD